MAYRALNTGEKMIALGVGAGAVGLFLNRLVIPYNVDMYKTLGHVYDLPRFKRDMTVEAWQHLQETASDDSLIKKHFSRQLLDKLKHSKTQHNGSLLTAMAEATAFPQSPVGAVASDPFVYDVFQPLFDPIVAELNGLPVNRSINHPKTDWGQLSKITEEFKPLDSNYVKRVSLECTRSLKYYVFGPSFEETSYYHFETMVNRALKKVAQNNPNDSELSGETFWFRKSKENDLKNLPVRFTNNDERLKALKCYQFWPIGRGVFQNGKKNLAIKFNEEEHLKFLTSDESGDLGGPFRRMAKITTAFGEEIPFGINDRLGNTAFSPKNIGNGLTVAFDVELPNLSKKDTFKETLTSLKLTASPAGGDKICIKNAYKLGATEYETAKLVYDGVKKLIDLEKQS